MTIIYSDETFAVICHLTWIENLYKLKKVNNNSLIYKLFDIRTPYLMDGKAQKIGRNLEDPTLSIEPKKKKRKLEVLPHNELKDILEKYQEHFSHFSVKQYFSFNAKATDYFQNNKIARETGQRFLEDSQSVSYMNEKNGDVMQFKTINGRKYIIPPNCHFICDNICNLHQHLFDKQFDIVVMDPPWLNKHVARKKKSRGLSHSYNMMTVEDIMKMDLKSILKPNSFVLIWVTSNEQLLKDLESSLAVWDLTIVQTWYWLKVTKSGDHICKHTDGKLPYEKLFITQHRPEKLRNIPELLFSGIPCAIHSHKPPLTDLLEKYLGISSKSHQCIEIFARNLIPGWTSIGLEVLKLQSSILYENEL